MAEFIPFKGLLYNSEIIENMSDVVAPPYDVISPNEQEALYAKDPRNIVRLILGKKKVGDDQNENGHTRAAAYFRQWLESRVLVRDEKAAFYLTTTEFEFQGRVVTRYGVIGLVRLEPFDKGIVLPHERTFSKVKSERLELMKKCHANFSPIFGLYSDTEGILARLQKMTDKQSADFDLKDINGLRHKLWRVQDPELIDHIKQALVGNQIYIADGHHRYETALNYCAWVRKNDPQFNDEHPANYIMMSLSSLQDPGLVIFPAHRLLKQVSEQDLRMLLPKAEEHFEIQAIPIGAEIHESLRKLDAFLDCHKDANTIGVYIKNADCIHAMKLKNGTMERLFAHEQSESLLNLDVTVLTRLVMMELLGFDQARLDDENKIAYQTTAHGALKTVQQGEADLAFILNPTKIEQVKRVAEENLIMPRKSTYFYPKVLSGHVLNLLR